MRLALPLVAVAGFVAWVSVGSAATAAAPANTRLPSISGTARDGSALTASKGAWTGSPTSFAFAWERCDSLGGGCGAIAGANSKVYTALSADVGHRLRVVVTATNSDGTGSATSRPTDVVAASGNRPQVTRLPALTGSPTQGAVLHTDHGSWSGTRPIRFDYSWQRCDASGNGCSTFMAHSNVTDYTLTGADIGHTIRVEVTAINSHGSTSVFGNPSGVVGRPATVVPVANVSLPDRLVIDRVSFSPNPVVSRSTAITARFHVSDTKGLSVQGALVYALGLPYGWTYNAPEQPTDGTGWATIAIQPTHNLPLRPGDLVMFVRARKPGENLLAGVSTRRLVQVAIR